MRQFLAFSSRDYLQPGRSSSLQKDKIEEEVVLFSKACSKQIGLLQERVSNLKDGGRMSGVSPQAVAHWQGVVRGPGPWLMPPCSPRASAACPSLIAGPSPFSPGPDLTSICVCCVLFNVSRLPRASGPWAGT